MCTPNETLNEAGLFFFFHSLVVPAVCSPHEGEVTGAGEFNGEPVGGRQLGAGNKFS